jgi:hypothetical protein
MKAYGTKAVRGTYSALNVYISFDDNRIVIERDDEYYAVVKKYCRLALSADNASFRVTEPQRFEHGYVERYVVVGVGGAEVRIRVHSVHHDVVRDDAVACAREELAVVLRALKNQDLKFIFDNSPDACHANANAVALALGKPLPYPKAEAIFQGTGLVWKKYCRVEQ